MGKKKQQAEEQSSLVEDLEQENADLQDALAEANERALRAARDADYYRNLEERRVEIDRAEQRRKQQAAERRERQARLANIVAGLLPLKGAASWQIVHGGSRPGVQVFVPLSEVELRAVQNYLQGTGSAPTYPFMQAEQPVHIVRGGISTASAQGYIDAMHEHLAKRRCIPFHSR